MSGRRAASPTPLPNGLPRFVGALAQRLQALPGIGEKAAQRHAIFLTMAPREVAHGIGLLLTALHDAIAPCARCGGLAERPAEGEAVCEICTDTKRDAGLLCLVAGVQDLLAMERSGAWRGRYFVLGRLVSPLEGVDVNDLPLDRLQAAVADGVREVVLALPASVEGQATALALRRHLGSVRVTRLAQGMAHGAVLEYADQMTVREALAGRVEVQ